MSHAHLHTCAVNNLPHTHPCTVDFNGLTSSPDPPPHLSDGFTSRNHLNNHLNNHTRVRLIDCADSLVVCVCVCEREREREGESMYVNVFVCDIYIYREREREREKREEKERECVWMYISKYV